MLLRIDPHHGAARAEPGAKHHEGEARTTLERAFVGTWLNPTSALPVELLGAGGDDFFQRIIGELLFLGWPPHIAERERHRIDAHLIADVVHDRFDAVDAMRVRRRAEIARSRAVGVNGIDFPQAIGAGVIVHAGNTAGVLAVGPHAAVAAQLHGGDGAVVLHADPVFLHRGPAAVNAEPVVAAGIFEHYRARNPAGKLGGDEVGVLVLVLVTETATHVLGDNPHLVVFETKIPGGVVTAIGDALGGRVQGELVAFPACQSAAGLHLGVVHEAGLVTLLEDLVSLGKARFHIADAGGHGFRIVAGIGAQIAFGPDSRRVLGQGGFGFEYERQGFVFDFDQRQRFLGDVAVGGRHRSNGIAHTAHGIVEDIAPVDGRVLDRIIVLPPAGNRARAPDDGTGLMGNYIEHARQGEGSGGIDRDDAGVYASQNFCGTHKSIVI